jgi:hypothetical protein
LGLQRDRARRRGSREARQQRAFRRNDTAGTDHGGAHAGTDSDGAAVHAGHAAGTGRRADSTEGRRASGLPACRRSGTGESRSRISHAGPAPGSGARCAVIGEARRRTCRTGACCRITRAAKRASREFVAVDSFRRSASDHAGNPTERGNPQHRGAGTAVGRTGDASGSGAANAASEADPGGDFCGSSTSRACCGHTRSSGTRSTACFGDAGAGSIAATESGRTGIHATTGARAHRCAAAA